MPQIVQAHSIETCVPADAVPGVVDVALMRAALPPRKDPGIAGDAGQLSEQLCRGRRQRHYPCVRLAVAQSQFARLEVHVVPAQPHNLVAPAPRQHQQPDCGRTVL